MLNGPQRDDACSKKMKSKIGRAFEVIMKHHKTINQKKKMLKGTLGFKKRVKEQRTQMGKHDVSLRN
jgi:hypothetical protein